VAVEESMAANSEVLLSMVLVVLGAGFVDDGLALLGR
jgi:hypothetical protein